jgi:hypothetical protein
LGLIASTIEETLRWDPPVHYLFRRATQDVSIAGATIPEGAMVTLLIASANRDETACGDDASEFDIDPVHTKPSVSVHTSVLARLSPEWKRPPHCSASSRCCHARSVPRNLSTTSIRSNSGARPRYRWSGRDSGGRAHPRNWRQDSRELRDGRMKAKPESIRPPPASMHWPVESLTFPAIGMH